MVSNLPVTGCYTIVITDMAGLVKKQVNSTGASVMRINIAALQKGIYYVKMADSETMSPGVQLIKE